MVETVPCWYCGKPSAHHGMCYGHSVHFNGAKKAAELQAEHDARESEAPEA